MTKEQKIDMLLAFLTPIIFDDKDEGTESAPQITFLSDTEVQIEEFPGKQLPVNKVYPNNPLKKMLEKIVNYNLRDERKNWEECCLEKLEDENIDLEDIYIPTLCWDHIYHTVHQLEDLIKDISESIEGATKNDYSGYFRDNRFLEFIQHEYDLKECSPTAMEIVVAAFGNIDNAIHEFNLLDK